MKNLSLKYKFFAYIGSAMLVLIGATAWLFISWQMEQTEKAFFERMEAIAISSRMMMHSAAEEYAKSEEMTFHRGLRLSPAEMKEMKQYLERARKEFEADKNAKVVDIMGTTAEGERKMYVFTPARLQDDCATCHASVGVDFGSKKSGDMVDVFGVSGSMEPMYATEANIRWIALAVGFILLAIVWLIILLLMRKLITRPLSALEEATGHVAAGDLTSQAEIFSNDEIGQISRSFNGMVDELGGALSQVKEASFALASASSEISASIEEMAAGAKEQTSHTSTVASAVEEMAASIHQSSETAKEAASTADQARNAAEKGGVVVSQTIDGMKSIAGVVRKSAETVELLGKSSQQIGEIVSVIDDIADQTNLLALNAAIEAARAGEHGRGFAVVADEVRKLADRTTKSTKEISVMIREIQTNTEQAVESMAEGTRRVDGGILLADKAGEALREIVKKSQNLMGKVDQMAISSGEQSKASEQIAKNVESISSVTQETSLGSDQISHAADDLNRLADNLQTLVRKFTLHEIMTSSAAPTKKQRNALTAPKRRLAAAQ